MFIPNIATKLQNIEFFLNVLQILDVSFAFAWRVVRVNDIRH